MYTLRDVFNEFTKNNIFVNLDENFLLTKNKKKPTYNNADFFGYIESIEDNDDDIIECLNEEGSASINYRFISTSRTFYKKTIIVILQSVLVKFGFEPFITKNKKDIGIELIITKDNLTDEYKSLFINELLEDVESDEEEDDKEENEEDEEEKEEKEEEDEEEEENEKDEDEDEKEEDDEDEKKEDEDEKEEEEDEDDNEEKEEKEEDEKEDECESVKSEEEIGDDV